MKKLTIGNQGMNRNTAPHLLGEQEYTFALNSIMEDSTGNSFSLSNEPSNFLCSSFRTGFKVIKAERDVVSGRTYFFLFNPTTGVSEIGYIDNTHNIISIEDTESECGCNFKNILETPLEEQTQLDTCIYFPLLTDTCNKCLNFSLEYPVKDVVIKHEKLGVRLYFSGDKNPPRYIDVENLSQYYVAQNSQCGEPDITMCNSEPLCEDCEDCNECLNCDRMKISPDFSIPCLSPNAIVAGGNLKLGTYTFLIAYSDVHGNEASNYYSVTSPISIFDVNNITMTQPEIARETNQAIRIDVEGLDRRFDYYKVVVIQSTNVDGTLRAFVEGIHSTSDSTIIYTSENNKSEITFDVITAKKPQIKSASGLSTNNGYLYQYGLEYETPWNLQPVINLLSAFVKWQTGVANEDLYADGVNDAKYGGYMRGEQVPLAIKFFTEDGTETNVFPFTGRPPSDDEISLVDTNSDDYKSINENAPQCDGGRTKKWQYYNTATVDDGQCSALEYAGTSEEISRINCSTEVLVKTGPFSYVIPSTVSFSNLVDFINENIDEIKTIGSPLYDATLAAWLTEASGNLTTCLAELAASLSASCEFTAALPVKSTMVTSVENEEIERLEKELIDYNLNAPPTVCAPYKASVDALMDYKIEDTAFMATHMNVGEKVYVRTNVNNTSCATPYTVSSVVQGQYLNYKGGASLASILDTRTSVASPGFASMLHKNMVWNKVVLGSPIIEITPSSACDSTEAGFTKRKIRLSTYNDCNSTATAIETFIVDLDIGQTIKLNASLYATSTVLIAIDSEYRTSNGGFIVEAPCGCFGIIQKPVEYISTKINFNRITFANSYEYEILCTYQIPVANKCQVAPYRKGIFGYWESTEVYPCNEELFDSSSLEISPSDVSLIQAKFEEYFTSGVDTDGNYILNTNTNLQGKAIRHYKMPSNQIAPFMNTTALPGFRESLIFPLGVTIDNSIIRLFLDIAVKNNLITQSQRNRIAKYEIFRADRTIDKSIIAKGLLYDTYQYVDESGNNVLYPNYPYNTLGDDVLHSKIAGGEIAHPYGSEKQNRWTFHGPDIHFGVKPSVPTEILREGDVYGKAVGSFREVEDHPKYVLLGEDAYLLANTLAVVEVAFETTMILGQAALDTIQAYYVSVGTAVGVNIVGSAIATTTLVAFGLATATSAFLKVGKLRYQWLTIFRDNGTPRNFAYYYTSQGWYNSFSPAAQMNSVRAITAKKYLKSGKFSLVENDGTRLSVNNLDRESSLFLSVGEYFLDYDSTLQNYDNAFSPTPSRNTAVGAGTCHSSQELSSNIASPYVSLYNYVPAQYGDLQDIRWINTGYCGNVRVDNTCETIYGGDTKISRFSLKRKIPLFHTSAMGLANQSPFAYSMYSNIGRVNYYADFDVELNDTIGDALFPDIGSNYRFNCHPSNKTFYVKPPSKFYLYYYGIPQFLVESEINCNFRYEGREPKDWAFSNGKDYHFWTQEKNVSIRHDNSYFYNFAYSRNLLNLGERPLRSNYQAEVYARLYNCPNCVAASLQDINEQNLVDPWLIYRPFDFYQFPTSYGKLIDLLPIGSQQIMARFENQFTVLNSIDVLRERLTPANKMLGTGIFGDSRPIELAISELGYAGTQHKANVSCEYGTFFVDARRGQVFNVPTNGKGLSEISAFNQKGQESGMRNWFAEHLPFKILKGVRDITDLDVDNAYNGVGISMVWDARYKRVFITKRDYQVKPTYANTIRFIDNKFYYQEYEQPDIEVQLTNMEYFEDASFTVAYSPLSDSWVSYYSFKPNYYIGHNNYFQSGINYNATGTLWSHLLSNKTFQVFYGEKFPWQIEVVQKNEYKSVMFGGFEYFMDTRRFHNAYDFAQKRNIGFNKANVYNHNNNSGVLNLIPSEVNNMFQRTKYPLYRASSTDILATVSQNSWKFNDVFNKVKDDQNNVPIFIGDINNIQKTINPKAMDYRMGKWQDRIRGDWTLINLEQDIHTQYKMIFKWGITQSL